jgi:hypothetical protein
LDLVKLRCFRMKIWHQKCLLIELTGLEIINTMGRLVNAMYAEVNIIILIPMHFTKISDMPHLHYFINVDNIVNMCNSSYAVFLFSLGRRKRSLPRLLIEDAAFFN